MRIAIVFLVAIALAQFLLQPRTREPEAVSMSATATSEPPIGSQAVSGKPVPVPAPAPSAPIDPAVDRAIRARVTSYWRARSRSNLLAAYPFYTPEFRKKYPQDQFLETFQRLLRFRPKFQDIERVLLEPDGRTARVSVRISTHPDALMGQELISIIDEVWRLIGGVWYRDGEALLPSF